MENPVDGGACWAAVHRVIQSQTRLRWLSMHACTGERNGNPFQYSCPENPRDGGAWWAAVYGVSRSRTWLKQLSSSSSSTSIIIVPRGSNLGKYSSVLVSIPTLNLLESLFKSSTNNFYPLKTRFRPTQYIKTLSTVICHYLSKYLEIFCDFIFILFLLKCIFLEIDMTVF